MAAILVMVAAGAATAFFSILLGKSTDTFSQAKKINPLWRGLIIDAVASSFPEFAVVVSGLIQGSFEIGLGTIAGSAIFNIVIIPAACGIAAGRLMVEQSTVLRDGGFYLMVITALAAVVAYAPFPPGNPEVREISPLAGWIAIAIYIAYAIAMFLFMGKDRDRHEEEDSPEGEDKIWPIMAKIIFSMMGIYASSHFLVKAGLELADELQVSEAVIGQIILAVITSLPDLFISLASTFRGDSEGAVGNAFGSNLFDVLICLGMPIAFQGGQIDWFMSKGVLLSAISFTALVLWMMRDGKLSRKESSVLLILYGAWVVMIIKGG